MISIDIASNGNIVATGFEDGAVGFWDLQKKQCVKIVSNIFETPVLQIKFISGDTVLASDNAGNLNLLKLKKSLLSFTIESKVVI